MSFKVVMTARVLARRDIEAYQRDLGVDFLTVPCQTEDEIIAAAQDADVVITVMQPFSVRAGKWNSFEKREIRGKVLPPVFQLRGQTLGLIGFGEIGRAVVPKAKGFGLRVIAFDPYLPPDVFEQAEVESVTLDQLLETADFVLIQASYSPQARHMIGMEQFWKMKPTAYIINTARGSFIDEAALYTALSEGYISGAGLDVVEAGPEGICPEHPLLTLDNVIITAHSAYYSEQSTAKYKQRIYEAVTNIINGKWPDWLVNPEVKKNFRKKWQQSQET